MSEHQDPFKDVIEVFFKRNNKSEIDELLCCPFCGEDDFDKEGLKGHIENGWCEEYNKTEYERKLF